MKKFFIQRRERKLPDFYLNNNRYSYHCEHFTLCREPPLAAVETATSLEQYGPNTRGEGQGDMIVLPAAYATGGGGGARTYQLPN